MDTNLDTMSNSTSSWNQFVRVWYRWASPKLLSRSRNYIY
jgi:hypothetical protein